MLRAEACIAPEGGRCRGVRRRDDLLEIMLAAASQPRTTVPPRTTVYGCRKSRHLASGWSWIGGGILHLRDGCKNLAGHRRTLTSRVPVSLVMHDPAPGFEAPPPQLVEHGRQHLGRFDGPPVRANLIDARYLGLAARRCGGGGSRSGRRSRSPRRDLFVNVGAVRRQAAPAAAGQDLRPRARRASTSTSGSCGRARSGSPISSLDSSTAYRDRRSMLRFDNRFARRSDRGRDRSAGDPPLPADRRPAGRPHRSRCVAGREPAVRRRRRHVLAQGHVPGRGRARGRCRHSPADHARCARAPRRSQGLLPVRDALGLGHQRDPRRGVAAPSAST